MMKKLNRKPEPEALKGNKEILTLKYCKESVKNACPTAITKAVESILDQSGKNINSTASEKAPSVVA